MSNMPHHKTKLAAKIDKKNEKNRAEGKKNTGGFGKAATPFHEGILPSQYNTQESALEKVGRKKRRKEW